MLLWIFLSILSTDTETDTGTDTDADADTGESGKGLLLWTFLSISNRSVVADLTELMTAARLTMAILIMTVMIMMMMNHHQMMMMRVANLMGFVMMVPDPAAELEGRTHRAN